MIEKGRKFIRNISGITLISLVVSIIVLIILTGVSISTLTGQDGILNRTQQARMTTLVKEEKEKVVIAVADALAQGTGEINEVLLRKSLTNNFQKIISLEKNFLWKVEGKYMSYIITLQGEVVEIPSSGAKINYKNEKNWKILYADKTDIFIMRDFDSNLKSDLKTEPSVTLASKITKYNGTSDFINYIERFPIVQNGWLKTIYKDGILIQECSNKSIKALEYLLDKENWKEYVDINYADYAIGAATIEMIEKTLNDEIVTYRWQNAGEPPDTPSCSGYYIKLNENLSTNNFLYCNEYYWLATPIRGGSPDVLAKIGKNLSSNSCMAINYIRPVVHLKDGTILEGNAVDGYTIKKYDSEM